MSASLSRIFLVSVLSAGLLLSACGFHLRGQIDVPESLMRMYVKGDDIDLVRDIESSLRFSDIEIVDNESGVAVLDMSDTVYLREVNGTNSNGIATSYKLRYTVNYVVLDPDREVIQTHKVFQDRFLAYDPAAVLVFEREEEFLKEDMRKELVSQILRRMSKIEA